MARITIAIPTHNRPRFLIRAVDSVLRQTYSDFELLILDNASEDRRWRRRQAFRDPRVRYISHRRNIGVVANWNAAVATSSCDAISIFHDDDVMSPRFIERIVEALSEWPSAGMVCAAARRVDCLGANLGTYPFPNYCGVLSGRDYVLWNLRMGGYGAIPSGVVIRRSTYDMVGPYGVHGWLSCFDLNYYLRVARQCDIGVINEELVHYTLHPHQICESSWRGRMLDGRIDVVLELCSAATWLLNREGLSERLRSEVTMALSDNIQRLADMQRRARGGRPF